MGFVREYDRPGGVMFRLWPEGGWPRYVRVGDVDMWEAFTFTAESFVRPGVRLELRIRVIDQTPQCVGLRLTSSHDDAPLAGAVVNQVDLEYWIEMACSRAIEYPAEAWESVERDVDGTPWIPASDATAEASDRARKAVRRIRRATAGYPNDMLRQVAEVYTANIDSFPTKAVGQTFAVAQSTAQLYVKKARERGFITAEAPTRGGRP